MIKDVDPTREAEGSDLFNLSNKKIFLLLNVILWVPETHFYQLYQFAKYCLRPPTGKELSWALGELPSL